MEVTVVVDIRDSQPGEETGDWDQINECSIDVSSGSIVVAGCTDYFPDAARIAVDPGLYRARICYGGLDTVSDDGLEGDDHYRIVLWPVAHSEPVVIKQRHILSKQ